MKRLDLIIDALEKAKDGWQCFDEYDKALAAAHELKALRPVAYMDSKGILFNDTTHPQLNTALYALDEVKHD